MDNNSLGLLAQKSKKMTNKKLAKRVSSFRTTCEPANRRFEKILFELMVLSQMVVNHLSKLIITQKKEMSIDGQKILYRI